MSGPYGFYRSSGDIDDAGLFRASSSRVVLEQGFEYSIPRGWEVVTAGGGTVALDTLKRSLTFNIGTASGARALLQQKSTVRWRWGHSMILLLTGVPNYLNTPLTGATKIRWGFFNDDDGQFLELNASGAFLVFRSSTSGSPVDILVPQSSWANDKLDGTGLSRFTVDWSRAQRVWHSASSPGAGRGRFGIYIREGWVQATQISSINTNTSVPFLKTVLLPPRIEIVNSGGVGSGCSSQLYSVAMLEEGPLGPDETGYTTHCSNGATLKSCPAGVLTPLLSIRLVDAMNSFQMRGKTIPLETGFLNTSNNPAFFRILENGALTGASFADIDTVNSITQFSTAETAISGGVVVDGGYIPSQGGSSSSAPVLDSHPNKVFLARNYAGTRDTLTVAAQGIGGTATVGSYMTLREVF